MTKASDRRLTDAQLKARKAAEEKAARELANLKRMLNAAFGTSDGIRALRHLKDMCGYDKTDVVGNPQTGEILDKSTFYNVVRRGVYAELRRFIKPEILMRVEFPTEDPDDIFEE